MVNNLRNKTHLASFNPVKGTKSVKRLFIELNIPIRSIRENKKNVSEKIQVFPSNSNS